MRNILSLSPAVAGLFAVLIGGSTPRAVFADGSPSWSYDTYDYTETVERGDIKQYRLAIPKGVTTVRGILVVSNCFGGDSRDWYKDGTAYESFINLHDFAFIGGKLDCSHYEAYDAFVKALAVWAEESGHPELVNVPYVSTGVSAGGGFASTLATRCPEKTIAVAIVCARLNLTVFELTKYDPNNPVPVPDAVIATPVLNITGETEYAASVIEPPLEAHRPVGALYGWAESPGHGHEYNGQEVLAMPYLEAALKLRYPSTGDVRIAPLELKPLDPESGWVADNRSWKSGLTMISPAAEFEGDLKTSSWLPDENVAFIYRAYATYDRPLRLTSPRQDNIYTPIHTPGSSVTITVDADGFPDWKKLEFYDGSTLLGTVTSGATQFTATNLTPGFHVFSVLGTDSAGKVVTSNCEMIAVHQRHASASESFTGTAARSGTFKRPLLDVNGTRYELQASTTADDSVTELLKKFSEGDTGAYVIEGTRATVNGKDGIIIDSITPTEQPLSSIGDTSPRTSPAPGSEPTAPAQTTTAVSSSLRTVGDDRYMVYHYDDGATKAYSVVIPEGLTKVRGLLINASYLGQDTREDWTICEYYRQFMHLHDFAFVGSANSAGGHPENAPPLTEDTARGRHYRSFQGFENSMKRVAASVRRPELANAPYVSLGFSHGGGTSFNMMVFAPEKTIAAVSYASPYNFKRRATFPVSDALLHVPSISITGEEEQFNAPLPPDVDPAEGPAKIYEVFVPYRPLGGQYAWLERQGLGHAYDANRQDVLGMPLLDAAVRARYPSDGDVTQGPIKLIDIDPATGWIADNTTWQSGLTEISPAGEFEGDLGHSSWLQNEDLAFIYRAYSTYDKPLTITSPGDCWPTMPTLEPGSSVPIVVDAGRFPGWTSMAFYDGAKKMGEIAAGAAPRFTATDLTPGYHVFSILATDSVGNVRTADPKLVIVKPQVD